jgi:hypothetical protein
MSKDKKKKRDKWRLKPSHKPFTASDFNISTPCKTSVTLEFVHDGTRYRGTAYPVEDTE